MLDYVIAILAPILIFSVHNFYIIEFLGEDFNGIGLKHVKNSINNKEIF